MSYEISDEISSASQVQYRYFAYRSLRSRLPAALGAAPRSACRGGEALVSIGPTVRRRRLGSELRRLREAHSFKLEEAADKLGLAASTLSRIETGKAPTRTAYLATMFEMYGVVDPGQRQVLTEMAREGHRKGWWAVYDDVLPTGFDVYVGLEAEAAALRVFEDQVVHGLLQTEAYARTVMTSVRRRQHPRQIERAVELRMERQKVLTRADPVKLWCILDEPVISRLIGGPEVMRGQLERLREASQWPRCTPGAERPVLHSGVSGAR
jgi:transcriptional regulator with XRE-family HTH domain